MPWIYLCANENETKRKRVKTKLVRKSSPILRIVKKYDFRACSESVCILGYNNKPKRKHWILCLLIALNHLSKTHIEWKFTFFYHSAIHFQRNDRELQFSSLRSFVSLAPQHRLRVHCIFAEFLFFHLIFMFRGPIGIAIRTRSTNFKCIFAPPNHTNTLSMELAERTTHNSLHLRSVAVHFSNFIRNWIMTFDDWWH